jgi:hypothetical protein
MRRLVCAILLGCASASLAEVVLADEQAETALRETRDLVARELFGHYDLRALEVLGAEDLRGRFSLPRDYGLVRVTLRFSATRNATRHSGLSSSLFEPGGRCEGGLYLHCGVPVGHVFEGTLELLMAVDREGSWRAVSPHWRSRRPYALEGYLLLDGRAKEGYVLPPAPRP